MKSPQTEAPAETLEQIAARITKQVSDVMFVGSQNRRWLAGLIESALP